MPAQPKLSIEEAVSRKLGRSAKDARHHYIFDKFSAFKGTVGDGLHGDFIGTMTRSTFVAWDHLPERPYQAQLPGFDEEYFEWADLLEAALDAEDSFTMIEFGAGYGR